MNTNTQNVSTQNNPRTNIVAVTGLPRPLLAAMFRRAGLFGRDSALTVVEQAVVQSRLPAVPNLAAPSAPSILGPRLKLLADYVDAVVAERDASAEQARLAREGYSQAAIGEAAITVDNVRTVFGLFPVTAGAVPVKAAEARNYARAA